MRQRMEQVAGANERKPGEIWLHRFALLTAVATFLLLCIGGVVTTKGVGLVVPDWPTTFGYNMFLFPWAKMVGGVFYEHGHRLIGALVGFLTLLLAIFLWLGESRKWLRWLGTIALGMVILQGVLGGLRVLLIQQTLAVIHGAFAHAFFALMISLALFTSREWQSPVEPVETPTANRLQRLALITTLLIYSQVVFGAILRHTGYRLDAHVVLAGLIMVHIALLVAQILKQPTVHSRVGRPVTLLGGCLLLQLLLGVGAYLIKFTPARGALGLGLIETIVTAHVAVGALLLATSMVVTLRLYRVVALPEATTGSRFLSEQVPV